MQTKLLEALSAAHDSSLMQMDGDICLVEEIKDAEFKTKSGLVLSAGLEKQVNGLEADKPTFVRILLVGDGFITDDGCTVPPEASVGEIVLVGKLAIKWFSVFGKLNALPDTRMGLIRAGEIQMRWPSQEAFDLWFEKLNAKLSEI